MKMNRYMLVAAALAGITHASVASAVITYLDASTLNTTNADGSAFSPTPEASRSNSDNLWAVRTNAGLTPTGTTGGTVYESNGTGATGINGTEDSPKLQTTIIGLIPGSTYNIYTYFYDQSGNTATEWGIESGLTLTGLTSYTGATDMTTAPISGTILVAPQAVADGNSGDLPTGYAISQGGAPVVDLYQASLGAAIASPSGTIAVFIDDFANPSTIANDRSRYDGVGSELASIPEPTGLIMVGSGASSLLIRRRRLT